jgi:predicted porin
MSLQSASSYGQATNEFYGRADLSLNHIDMESFIPQQQEWQPNSNASRIGYRGSYQLTDSLEAIYQVELEVNFDDDDSFSARNKELFENRNTFIGLRGNFGQIIAGKHDSPVKTMGREVDRFNDQVLGDVKNFMEGEDRIGDLLLYTTPDWKGFSATTGVVTRANPNGTTGNSGIGEGTSVSLNFSNDFITTALGINNDIDKQDLTRLMANFYIGAGEIGFMWQQADRIDKNTDEESWFVSAEYRINEDWRIKGQYGMTDYSVLASKDKQFVLGLDRILSSNTFVFINYVEDDRDRTAASFADSGLAIGFQIRF